MPIIYALHVVILIGVLLFVMVISLAVALMQCKRLPFTPETKIEAHHENT